MKEFGHGLKGRLQIALGTTGLALYSFLGCLFVMGIAGLVALLTAEPMLFPSLGPTVLMFFDSPLTPPASPRHTLIGHAVALIAGWISLALFGLLATPSALAVGVHGPRIGAAALSLAITVFVLRLARAPHPPAGATTLIVSLGFLTTRLDLALMMAAIVLVTVSGWSLNRLMSVPAPVWSPKSQA